MLMVLAISIGIGITITTLNVYQLMSENPAGERSDNLIAVQLWSQGKDTWTEFNRQVTYQDAYNLRKNDIPVHQTAMFVTGLAVQTEDPDFVPLLETVRVTDSDFFDMFSVPFIYGKAWDKSVDTEASYQVVINEALNKQLFAGEDSIGKTLYLDRKPYQIVGVTKTWSPSPRYYDITTGAFNDSAQIFVPFSLAPIEEFASRGNNEGWKREPINNYNQLLSSERHWVQYWVEVQDDTQRDEYAQWLKRYVEQQQLLGRFDSPDAAAQLSNVEQWLDINEVVPEDNKILVGLSALFLLVCLVNMLGLLLTKFLKRAPEVGVRRAIGASRVQIFFQHMVEVGLIGFGGGLLGLLWAWVSLSMLSAHFALEDALTQLDLTMWVLAPTIAIVAALSAGVYPAWRICSTNPSVHLKSQ